MKYFIDTEFIEGFHKPLFGKKRHFIDLISIGIVAEDGRQYYAISNEYSYSKADEWVKVNVITKAYRNIVHGDSRNRFRVESFHHHFGKKNKKIAKEILEFVYPHISCKFKKNMEEFYIRTIKYGWNEQLEFYGYYADYDWVLFCSLFGKMIDLPKDFPMYCKDIKQMLDDKANNLITMGKGTHSAGDKWYADNTEEALSELKNHPSFPIQYDEHDAILDAMWNKKLYEYLQSI